VISESGRALTAHHALLLVKVIDVESQARAAAPQLTDDDHSLLHEMPRTGALRRRRRPRKVLEVSHDALSTRTARAALQHARADLRAGARRSSSTRDDERDLAHRGATATSYDELPPSWSSLVDRYFCNFSLFQSLPDSWAIDQLFPIMPIHRLREEPVRRGTLQDVTCDSDGQDRSLRR
jgi:arginine decarboxylase